MPSAKRQKATKTAAAAPDPAPAPTASTATAQGDETEFARIARLHWLKPTRKNAKVKVKSDVLKKEIWSRLEGDGFEYKSLLELEGLQLLESYLWPGYTEESSNIHVILVALISNVKRREQVETWQIFESNPDAFSDMFRRLLAMTLDATQPTPVRTHLLCFLIAAFQSLDCGVVRKECAPLVSIAIWQNLSSDALRETKLSQSTHLRKAWRASQKRFDAADEAGQVRLRFERSWLYTLVLQFLGILYSESCPKDSVAYCERLTELLCDLQSQLPTRRYVNSLLRDLQVLPTMKLSPMYSDEQNIVLRDLHALLTHYTFFTVDDHTGAQLSKTQSFDRHCAVLAHLQRVSLQHFKEKLTVLALSNYGAIDKRGDLAGLLEPLTDDELASLATQLQIRTSFPSEVSIPVDRRLLMEVLLSTFERRKSFQDNVRSTSLVPTEVLLFDNSLLRTDDYDGSHPLPTPKLNLQYLSVGDFLWRAFVLYRCEAFYAIKRDIELAVARLRPNSDPKGISSVLSSSKMAAPSSKAAILEVLPPHVGEDEPAMVRAEISLDLRSQGDATRREWNSLRVDDVVFLLSVEPEVSKAAANGSDGAPAGKRLGIKSVRTAEVLEVLDDQGRSLKQHSHYSNSRARLILKLDPATYVNDLARAELGHGDVYQGINVILRRRSRENNFKRVLEAIRNLVLSDIPLPSWLHEVFLGYGDPSSVTYRHLSTRVKSVDMRDTFMDWQHLIESLPGKIVEPDDEVSGSFGPPYVLEAADKKPDAPEAKPSKKRRRGAESTLAAEVETLRVSTYKPPNNGPYPVDVPRQNSIRFTPAQVDAIVSGTQPGLTLIVGPPGTGKTDVVTQVISNIYHNFPKQKTLLIAHSNQALNQLFAKIVALDIDDRHLLRLGHGEDELETDSSFSKHGRVESFLDNLRRCLGEVSKLAASIGAPGAHGQSAETAGYFNSVYVKPSWARFEETAGSEGASVEDIVRAFPFHDYFADAPQPLFSPDADRDEVLEVAGGCYRHIAKVFVELEDAQPFEILRRERDRANYLMTAEARVIAMTSTHAAMRRSEIANLGFQYDNVVMEEASQITEIENFIPLALQKPRDGKSSLQRVVLCGDHFQNSPVVQNVAFRQFSNLDQSLFARLVRLGVPTMLLDQQGRARPSIASLYKWRYPGLDNLPHVLREPEYLAANAGFKFDYQFVHVPNYKGKGETEPSPHFIQNLGEAEYAVAIFQYMRLLGYPASKISILTTYAGQRALVRDVLSHRCAKNPVFGLPRAVSTVDKYQGEQNDYIILSLTRTSRVGYLRDVRRMTVALSRARLGLYILGRREVFESCHELSQAFEPLFQRPNQLMLVTGEMWPTQRPSSEDPAAAVDGEVAMDGVEHLGQYVFEMTKTRLQQLQAESAVPPAGAEEGLGPIEEDEEDDGDQEVLGDVGLGGAQEEE